jgi:hypothetical protein
MDGIATEIQRDAAGRFVAGQSGNPAGKRQGTRNRKTVLLEALRDGEGEAAARVVIERALAGDAVAARFVVSLISPRPRGRTIQLEMPEDDDCNVVAAYNSALRALCEGEITPDEAVQVSRFLDGRRRVLQAWQLEDKLTAYGRVIPGDPDWGAEDEDEDDADDDADSEEDDRLVIHAAPPAPAAAPTPPEAPVAAAPAATPEPAPAASAAPVAAGESPLPPVAEPSLPPLPAAPALQSTCILPSPLAVSQKPLAAAGTRFLRERGTIRGFLSIPVGGFDRALAASVARRLGAGAAVR